LLREEQLDVIVLAAGAGRRLGRDKATLAWGAGTLVEHVVKQFAGDRVARRVVVANLQNELLLRQVLPADVDVVVNPDSDAEMIASVRLGMEALGALQGPLCIHPVDVFAVCPALVELLHEGWLRNRERIHLPEVGGKGAHPLIVPLCLASEIETIPAGSGLNWLVRKHPGDVVRHRWPDDRLLLDIDTPEDYARYRPAGPGANRED
jgi:CTP:molybdopterin cytidylyltransferase MocA